MNVDVGMVPQATQTVKPRPEPTLILWDLVGSCNLKCPSCPMGNMRPADSAGFIDETLFNSILRKLQSDFACRQLHFYNWTEPLLHPRLALFCQVAVDAGFHVHLSSNLNHMNDAEGILASGIKTFRISLSGFTQAVYAIGHRGGKIEKVKANMIRLAEAKRATGSRTRIHVYFHQYRHNLHERAAMEVFSRELGFEFLSDWAFLMPLEKLLAYADGSLGEPDRILADEQIVPPAHAALSLVQQHGGCSMKCELIEQLVLDHRGRATLCCATFDSTSNVIGDYLDLDWGELQRRRYKHATCSTCTAIGAHALYTNVSHPPLRDALTQLAGQMLQEQIPRRNSIRLPILNSPMRDLAESA